MGAFASAQDPATEVVAKGGNWEIFANGDMEWNNEPIAEGYARLLVIPTLRTWDLKVPPKITKLEGHDGAYVGDSMATVLNIDNTNTGMCPGDFSGLDANIDFCIRAAPTARDTKQVRFNNMDGTFNRYETHIKRFQFRPLAIMDLMAEPKERVIVTLKDGADTPATDDEIRLELILLNTKKPTVSLVVPDGGRTVEEGAPVIFHLKLPSPMRTALTGVMYYLCQDNKSYFAGRRCGIETTMIPAGGDGMVDVTVPTRTQNCNNDRDYTAQVLAFSISGSNYSGSGPISRVTVSNGTVKDIPELTISNWPPGRSITEGQEAVFLIQSMCPFAHGRSTFASIDLDVVVEDPVGSNFTDEDNDDSHPFTYGPGDTSWATVVMIETKDDDDDEPNGMITVRLRKRGESADLDTATINVMDND